MKTLLEIKRQLRIGKFEFSRHAFKRAVEHNICEQEIQDIAENLEIIEDYPDDKYSPSSLLLGITKGNRSLHIQVSRIESQFTKIITLYEPDPQKWIDYKFRR